MADETIAILLVFIVGILIGVALDSTTNNRKINDIGAAMCDQYGLNLDSVKVNDKGLLDVKCDTGVVSIISLPKLGLCNDTSNIERRCD